MDKSQGQSIKKAMVYLGKSEANARLAIGCLSRAKQLVDLLVEPMPFDRLSKLGDKPTQNSSREGSPRGTPERSPSPESLAEHTPDADHDVESAGNARFAPAAGGGKSVWQSSAPEDDRSSSPSRSPPPSSCGIEAPRNSHCSVTSSPRYGGLNREALLLASADGINSDASLEGGPVEAPPSVDVVSTGVEVETSSCGYEGNVGDSIEFTPSSFRRVAEAADMVISTPKGSLQGTSKGDDDDDDEDDDDEGGPSRKPVDKSGVHYQHQDQPTGLFSSDTASKLNCLTSWSKMPRTAVESPWKGLNETLREQGFREVPLSPLSPQSRHTGAMVVPDSASLAETFRQVVFQHGERGKVIQDMSLELSKHSQVSGHRDQIMHESFTRQKRELSRRCEDAENRATELEEEKERLQDRLARESRRRKTENANLASQLKQSEHRVKAKEAAAQMLMDKLRNEAQKERLSQQREREVLNKFQQETRRGSTNNSRLAESLIANKKARERTEIEMDSLRAEVSRLGDELREKENKMIMMTQRQPLGVDWKSNHVDEHSEELRDLRDRLAEAERSVRIMRQREARALERCTEMETECQNVQTKMDETQESLVNAQLELASRPSLRNWRASQRRIQDLEKKLAQATSQAKEARDVMELRRWVDTRELMRRDRGNHRLQLDRLDELPSSVMKQVLQDACRILALHDVSLLPPSLTKLTKAVQMLPRLERFVNTVCGFVFRYSPELLCESGSGSLSQVLEGRRRTMEDVIPLLELWLARAQEPVNLREFREGVLSILETRARQSRPQGKDGPLGKSDNAVQAEIQHLVELERRSLEELELNNHVEWSMNDDPELPVNRVVRHFQLLFGVNSVRGCTAKLNEVYRFSSQTQTFFRTVGDLLDMPDASPEAVMKRLEAVLERRIDVDPDARLRTSHDANSWAADHSVDVAID